jgi:FAD:protein FMN transferase
MENNGVRTFAPVPHEAMSEPPVARRLRIAMGTLIALQATARSVAEAEAALEAAFTALTEVSRRMHPHAADSDLARINDSALLRPVEVHPSTCRLLDFARRLNLLTDGVFDPCLPTRMGRLADLEVTCDTVVCRAPVALDLGGIAKGYAVDCAVEVLLERGCRAGLVNAGGDLRVFGSHVEPVFLRLPAGDLVEIVLADGALAVSDAKSTNHPSEHQGYYVRDDAHVQPLVADYAAVAAKRAVIADALAKCVLLCRTETAERALRTFDATRLASQ